MNYFVSLDTDIWVERKKYISKKYLELNELRHTVLLN